MAMTSLSTATKEIEYEEVQYDPPQVILQRLRDLEDEIRQDLNALEEMLG
jgi:type I restriction enzyme M protein